MQTLDLALSSGVRLHCRRTDPAPASHPGPLPRVLCLHGFPQGGFVWEPLIAALQQQAEVWAPDLRGYGASSAPAEPAAYRGRALTADVLALIEQIGAPLDLLVAHDWGGALAWNVAALRPDLLRRLLIINAPHPATFLRELQHNPAQQRASLYMRALCHPEAATQLAADDFAAMWQFLAAMSPTAGGPGGWLDEAMRGRHRAVWQAGLAPALQWYAQSPLKPPMGPDDPVQALQLPAELCTVRVPTRVLWGEADAALLPGLLDGLEAWVPELSVRRVPGASHWLIHEQPQLLLEEVRAALGWVPAPAA